MSVKYPIASILCVALAASPVSAQDGGKPGGFGDRTGKNREAALRDGGGTEASEAAVASGLKWLIRLQEPDGRWMLNGSRLADKDKGSQVNDAAATAFGLLPFLAAGHTHKPGKANPYDKNIDKGLKFLIRTQDKKTGYFGGTMYAHGLATITLCEAYGMTKDPALRAAAQGGINLIINVQHDGGGWRYTPAKTPGDMCISGWQMLALTTAQRAGLNVPNDTIKKAIAFLNSDTNPVDDGYGYTPGQGSTPRMTAVALLCRQNVQAWGPAHPKVLKGVENFITKNQPDRQDVYYYYYATQVMFNVGGKSWTDWNDKMRDFLVKKQETDEKSPNHGSWAPQGDVFGQQGGRLMMTSMNLLTLEVYYRHTPLFPREPAE